MEMSSAAMKISAGTAEKQRELTQRQIDLTLRQASAELVFQNYKGQSTSGNEEKTIVSFDLANIGGSAATEIREDGTTGVYHRIEEAVGATVVKAQLDRGDIRTGYIRFARGELPHWF